MPSNRATSRNGTPSITSHVAAVCRRTWGLSAASTVSIGGALTIAPYTHTDTIGVGPTSGSTLNISDALINKFSGATSYIFGAATAGDGTATSGALTVNSATNFGSKNVTFVSGSTINFANTLTTTGGNLTFSEPVVLSAASTINAGSGTETFSGTIDGAYNLTASAGTFSFGGALGATTPLAAVSLTSASSLSLPSISAASILAQTTGATADITIPSGSVLTASGTGTAVTLASGRNFINSDGSGAISMTGGGRWLIYSATPGADMFGSLNSNNTAVWDATYGGTISQSGNRYIFSYQPTVIFTSTSDSKIYGVNDTSAVAADYAITGLQAGVANAFAADTNSTAFSGTPTVTSTGSVTSASVAGSPYAITVTAGSVVAVHGYALAYSSPGVLTVNPAPLTITANSPSMIYGASSLPTLSASYNGFVNGDTATSLSTAPTLATTATAYNGAAGSGSSVGTYATTASNAVDSNYTISYTAGVLTVNPAPLTITANSPSMIYGASSLPALTASYSGFVNGNTAASLSAAPTLSTTATAYNGTAGSGSNVGTYTTTASNAVDSNYTISYTAGVLTVNPAPLTIAANSPSMTYGASSLPTLSASYSGLANGDTASSLATAPTITTAATAYSGTAGSGSNVGTYATTASNAVDSNYTITYTAGALTVNPAPLTITANSPSMTYGASLPTLTSSYSGFVNGNTSASLSTAPTLSTTATAYNGTAGSGSNVGTYATTASNVIDSNYTISYTAGVLTVNPAPLTITADNQTVVYGASVPTGTITYNGFVNGNSVSNLTSIPTVSSVHSGVLNAGTYADNYTVSGAANSNYTITYVNGDLTVQQRGLTVTTNSITINQGGTTPVFSGSNNLLSQDVPLINWSYAPTGYSGNAGSYTIVASASDPYDRLANYIVTMIDGVFTVVSTTPPPPPTVPAPVVTVPTPTIAQIIPSTVKVTSQSPIENSSLSVQPYSTTLSQTSNDSGNANTSGSIFAVSSGNLANSFGAIDLEMSLSLQQQLGYFFRNTLTN